MDTAAKDKAQLLAKINNQLQPGAIILLHDSMELTAAVLPELIESIQAKGYKITGLDELLNIRAYA
jgi:peptidoglycan/xylan/chitin deacetylase (PgdA/CDA1 family)